MTEPLLHLITTAGWRAALDAGAVSPPSLHDVGFVHLSTPEQVGLPANRIFHGHRDLLLLVLDPGRIGVEIRFEPGLPSDPSSMRFPHAYGPVPTSAVLAVLPYRPGPDGGFAAPAVPATGPAGRAAVIEPSLLRRTATSEIPVTGGVAVITAPLPGSSQHNQLLIDGLVDAAQLVADADTTLGAAGFAHRRALLTGAHLAATAAGLARRGWEVIPRVTMSAPAGGEADPRVEHVDREALMCDARRRREVPGIPDAGTAQPTDRYRYEEAVIDLRYLGVREAGAFVSSCQLKIDGGTALLDLVVTDPDHRDRGHGAALVRTAGALAARSGCDLMVLAAAVEDRPRHWYTGCGFVEVGRTWSAVRSL